MRKLLLLVIMLRAGQVQAQTDLLVMKQRGHIIQTWVRGSFFSFQFINKQWIQGRIKDLRNDSLLIDVMVFQPVITRYGVPAIDTGRVGLLKLHVKEVYAMPKRNPGSGLLANGKLLQVGSGGFIFLNIFNSLINNEAVFGHNNLKAIGIATGVFGIGTLLAITRKEYIVLGKKYTLEVLHTAPDR
jgi:hypothetical protein